MFAYSNSLEFKTKLKFAISSLTINNKSDRFGKICIALTIGIPNLTHYNLKFGYRSKGEFQFQLKFR